MVTRPGADSVSASRRGRAARTRGWALPKTQTRSRPSPTGRQLPLAQPGPVPSKVTLGGMATCQQRAELPKSDVLLKKVVKYFVLFWSIAREHLRRGRTGAENCTSLSGNKHWEKVERVSLVGLSSQQSNKGPYKRRDRVANGSVPERCKGPITIVVTVTIEEPHECSRLGGRNKPEAVVDPNPEAMLSTRAMPSLGVAVHNCRNGDVGMKEATITQPGVQVGVSEVLCLLSNPQGVSCLPRCVVKDHAILEPGALNAAQQQRKRGARSGFSGMDKLSSHWSPRVAVTTADNEQPLAMRREKLVGIENENEKVLPQRVQDDGQPLKKAPSTAQPVNVLDA